MTLITILNQVHNEEVHHQYNWGRLTKQFVNAKVYSGYSILALGLSTSEPAGLYLTPLFFSLWFRLLFTSIHSDKFTDQVPFVFEQGCFLILLILTLSCASHTHSPNAICIPWDFHIALEHFSRSPLHIN